MALLDLKPNQKRLVFDLAGEAGFDTEDWINSSSSATAYKANPKYCYNWSFLQPDRVLILNLWFDSLTEESDGTVTSIGNYRLDASQLRAQGGKAKWIERGLAFDNQLQKAARDALPIRVILNHGTRRNRGDATAAASKVDYRDLDDEPWHIKFYDPGTGDFTLARGVAGNSVVDQFDVQDQQIGSDNRERKVRLQGLYARDPAVRRAALARSGGCCELCGVDGFLMESGARYLETHHIVPLSEGGTDKPANVIALCANDHRRAHYGIDRVDLRRRLLSKISF